MPWSRFYFVGQKLEEDAFCFLQARDTLAFAFGAHGGPDIQDVDGRFLAGHGIRMRCGAKGWGERWKKGKGGEG